MGCPGETQCNLSEVVINGFILLLTSQGINPQLLINQNEEATQGNFSYHWGRVGSWSAFLMDLESPNMIIQAKRLEQRGS